jgi:replicative DNA helicase
VIQYIEINRASLEELGRRNAAPVESIPVPFPEWAQSCLEAGGGEGLALGWHVLAAGRSGEGKTYLATNVAAHAIDATPHTVAFHSLEMSAAEITGRVLANVSGSPGYRLSRGKHHSPQAYAEAVDKYEAASGRIFTNKDPMFKLSDLLASIRRQFETKGARLHIVDYLQLLWTGNAESQADRITEVSHSVRQLAKELNIVTFCLSQFNRNTSKERDDRPQKEGMIGGSALENDADQVLLMDHSRKALIRNNLGYVEGWDGWLLLDKNRHGPSIDIPIRFIASNGRMRQRMPDEIRPDEVKK